MLAKQLHFEYEYVLSEDGKFGSPTANGSWNGLIKMLLDNVSTVTMVTDFIKRSCFITILSTVTLLNH